MIETEMMKRYEAETDEIATWSWHNKEFVTDDYIAWLEAQLTWRSVSEKPKKRQEVIISYVDCYGNRVQSMGSYVHKFDESADYADDSVCEYCEEKDDYYLREGWYESTNNSEYDSWLLKEKVDMWLTIPPAPEGEVKELIEKIKESL